MCLAPFRYCCRDVQVILVKDGDHRLSRPQDLALLRRTLGPAPRPGWRVALRDSSDTASAGRAPAGSARLDTLRFSAQKLRAIGLIVAHSGSNGTGIGRRDAEQPRRLGHRRPRSPPVRRPPGAGPRDPASRGPAASPPSRRARCRRDGCGRSVWPGLATRRAVPARRSSNAERPGP